MPGKGINLDEYVDVAERIRMFAAKYPEGSLQSEMVEAPDGFIAIKAYAYRNHQDQRPGVGHAWEPFPGLTPYTRNSELQNAETSAWGRAIVAVLAAETKKIASRQEVRNREKDPWPEAVDPAAPAVAAATVGSASSERPGEGSTPASSEYGEGSQPDLSDILEDTTLEKIVDKFGVNKALAAARRMGFKVTSLGQLTEAEAQQMLDGEVA